MLTCRFGSDVNTTINPFSKQDDEDESERDWKGEAKEASRRLQEERQEVNYHKDLKVRVIFGNFWQLFSNLLHLLAIFCQLKSRRRARR